MPSRSYEPESSTDDVGWELFSCASPQPCAASDLLCEEQDNSKDFVPGRRSRDAFEDVVESHGSMSDIGSSSFNFGNPWPRSEVDDSIPWADLTGPPRGRSPSRTKVGMPRVVASHAATRGRSVETKVNPLTGFMTLVFPACDYLVDASDAIDVEVLRNLLCLDRELASALMIRRLSSGRYEIDGRRVSIFWGGPRAANLYALEEDITDQAKAPVPFFVYASQAASIAAQIQPAAPRTLTFSDKGVDTMLIASEADMARSEWMQVAVEQARLREETAEAYRRTWR